LKQLAENEVELQQIQELVGRDEDRANSKHQAVGQGLLLDGLMV
jgi:hypothetical protein